MLSVMNINIFSVKLIKSFLRAKLKRRSWKGNTMTASTWGPRSERNTKGVKVKKGDIGPPRHNLLTSQFCLLLEFTTFIQLVEVR